MTTRNRPLYDRDYYAYARSLGLCGRCKKRDALAGMAYCRVCWQVNRANNERRQGVPTRRYRSKLTRAEGR